MKDLSIVRRNLLQTPINIKLNIGKYIVNMTKVALMHTQQQTLKSNNSKKKSRIRLSYLIVFGGEDIQTVLNNVMAIRVLCQLNYCRRDG